jgi:orotidine-5'-phosphate decarboxylase
MSNAPISFCQRLQQVADRKNSWLCVGLDPAPDKFPDALKDDPDAVLKFNQAIIAATNQYAAAFKINLAFYETLGKEGHAILQETIAAIPKETIIIADAKRGDIANTARQYARATLEVLNADAVTVNPYMGLDTLEPFLDFPGKGIFVLCLTSNPGARDFQYLPVNGRPLYEVLLQKLVENLPVESFGIVAGATQAEQLGSLRSIAPDTPFLVPGIGAQGGDLEKAVRLGGNSRGDLALINASRSILYASQDEDFAEAAAQEAKKLRDDMNAIRQTCHE